MSVVLTIKVIPNAKKLKILLEATGELKVYLKSPPVDGKANQELIAFFAKSLKLPRNMVIILSGLTSRNKRIELQMDLTRQEIYQKLGLEQQLSLI